MINDFSPLWISLRTAGASTIITFLLGLIAAWYVTFYLKRFKGMVDSLFTLPMVLPPTVLGVFLLLIFGRNSGFGQVLHSIGIQIVFSWWATVIAAVVVSFPLMYKTTKGAFEQVDPNLFFAARTLGASEWRIFWKVMVPIAWPGIAAGTVLAFTRALGEFGATLMFAGNIPGKTQTIPMAIFFAVEGGQMDRAIVWVLLITLLTVVVMFMMNLWNNYQRNRFTKGAAGR
ncbi:molybdate ABC transporter permease subunit [Isachenkonia alkalipeptolytica]|uniref:molybdate ABC transporter permease subunit n=1 Tax=Isachenkonia alkalipeptolytica TaxID=2565777 RepID=UPI00352FA9C9